MLDSMSREKVAKFLVDKFSSIIGAQDFHHLTKFIFAQICIYS